MLFAATPLSLAAAGLYALVALAAGGAAITARSRGQPSWHWHGWAGLALLFLLLCLARIANAEEALRELLREDLRAAAAYEGRAGFQRPLVAGLLVIAAALGAWLAWRFAPALRGRRNVAMAAALGGALLMLLLITLRMVSLHAVDALLYGPLKVNWLGDIGASCLVGGAAIRYLWLIRNSA